MSAVHERVANKQADARMNGDHDEKFVPNAAPWPLTGQPLRSDWRLLAAAGAITEAAAHIPVTEKHLLEAPYIGVGFVLLTVAGFLLAGLLLMSDSHAVWVATAVVSTLALFGYLLSRSIGLPQIHDDIGDWADALGLVAVTGEVLMLAASLVHVLARPGRLA